MPAEQSPNMASEEWFLRGDHNLESAKLLLEQGGPTDTTGVLIHQAAEKYLKGYLLTQGWKLQKTHDLEVLVSEAARHDRTFEEFLDLARALSAFYLEDRYPPGLPKDFPREEIADMLEQAEKLIAQIKGAIG